MRRVLGGVLATTCLVALVCLTSGAVSAPAAGGQLTVGVGTADASWHVGASAGQYAGSPDDDPQEFVSHENETFDPTGLATRRTPSYGIQSRLSARAIVIDGPDAGTADRFAIVKNDQYIPQDLVNRRAAQIVEQECPSCGINETNLTVTSSHSHSSPMYSSTSWGVWAFQDVFDIRNFEYLARQMATAVIRASGAMKPARVGAASTYFDKTHRHSFGPQIADDGTPAGYPQSDTDHDMSVVRFDDITDPANPKPLANFVNWSQHGEFLSGNNLISGDWVGPFERMLDRETGAVTVISQGALGTSESERSSYHSIHQRLEFDHREYAQMEWGARLMADAAFQAWQGIGTDAPPDTAKYLSFADFGTAPQVRVNDHWFPGPLTHPYPAVSNCRSDSAFAGDPLIPIVGLPDCQHLSAALGTIGVPGPGEAGLPVPDPGLSTDDFQAAGIPVPENYGAPSYTGLEEDIDIHLQSLRIGDLLLPVCSCEQWWDQNRNIELRTDKIVGNETLPGNLGYDWGAQCTADGDGTYTPAGDGTGHWHCPNPNNPSTQLAQAFTDHEVKRMRAQVNNPANGWNNIENVLTADSEPVNATQIKGNYTNDDDATNAALGYAMTIPVSMANDYNGYIATYREFQRGDHYRKALTGWGPHSSDYMASRLATLARQMNGAYTLPSDQQTETAYLPKTVADLAVNDARAQALGTNGEAAIAAFEAGLPDDGGSALILKQPADVERFGAAFFRWNGGSNYTDNPVVKVQRETSPGVWEDYADQSGELPVTLAFPATTDTPAYLSADQEWHWTARFEAFVAGAEDATINTGDRAPATPAGNYRFTVDGQRRSGNAVTGYSLTSDTFAVKPWSGILVQDFNLAPDNTMSFQVGPRSTYQATGGGIKGTPGDDLSAVIGPVDYPDTHTDPAPFIKNKRVFARDPAAPNDASRLEWYCFTCTWRPWIDFGDAQTAQVVVTLAGGGTEIVDATRAGDRWVTTRPLQPGESAQVQAGGVLDAFGNTNQLSAILALGSGPVDTDGDGVPDATDQCPSVAGPASNDGCPDPNPLDGDGDGVPNAADNCPGAPGPIDNFGCPLAQPPVQCSTPVTGTAGADKLTGTDAGDLILGLGGPDSIRGGPGRDCLIGGRGRDKLYGQAGPDLVRGGDGADRVVGGPGTDTVSGGRQRDKISGGGGNDRIRSIDRWRDVVGCGKGMDSVRANPRDRIAADCEHVKIIGKG